MNTFRERLQEQLPIFRFLAWPYSLSFLFTLVSRHLSEWLGISLLLMPVIGLLIWLPFVAVLAVRLWKRTAQEKAELEARFEAEDKELFKRDCKDA